MGRSRGRENSKCGALKGTEPSACEGQEDCQGSQGEYRRWVGRRARKAIEIIGCSPQQSKCYKTVSGKNADGQKFGQSVIKLMTNATL